MCVTLLLPWPAWRDDHAQARGLALGPGLVQVLLSRSHPAQIRHQRRLVDPDVIVQQVGIEYRRAIMAPGQLHICVSVAIASQLVADARGPEKSIQAFRQRQHAMRPSEHRFPDFPDFAGQGVCDHDVRPVRIDAGHAHQALQVRRRGTRRRIVGHVRIDQRLVVIGLQGDNAGRELLRGIQVKPLGAEESLQYLR